MKNIEMKDLSFYLIPAANPEKEFVSIHNKAYHLWRDVWIKVFNDLKFNTAFLIDDFIRQDFISVIMHNDIPAAVHLYSFFSLDCEVAREHRYLKENFTHEYFDRLQSRGVRNVMSMEYMTVHPEFRKGLVNLHIGQILVGLAMFTMKEYGGDAAIAPARRDHKVHDLAYAMGGESVISNVINHNVACDLLMCTKENVRPHENPTIRSAMESLWGRRVVRASIEQQSEIKKAA
jgi:hypothetical protein